MGNSLSSDDFKCIGGEGWYKERCSNNFLLTVTSKVFGENPYIPDVFRENESIRFSRVQNIRLSESLRKIYLDNIRNYALKSAAGVLQAEDTLGLETVHLQELSVIVNTTSSFEEFFLRRNALIIFIHRILRSAQMYNASLRPSQPGATTFCICNRNPHLEYCPLHDIQDDEKKFLFLSLQPNMRVQRGPDWQWTDQDGGMGHQGTITAVKDWKNVPNTAVKVKWDNGNENSYRYGGESCYDVVLANPVSHKDYKPLQGIEHPSCINWNDYCDVYISSGIAKTRSLFHSKISKQRLQLMLPKFSSESRIDETFIQNAKEVIEEVLALARQDTDDFFDSNRKRKGYEKNVCSETARMEVLLPYQIYLFSQSQGDLEYQRTETNILEYYLSVIHAIIMDILKKAYFCYQQHQQSISDILDALHSSILYELVPFIMTCLYVGSLPDDIMLTADIQISDMVKIWTTFLNAARLTVDTVDDEDNDNQTALFSKLYSSVPSSKTPWYLSLLYILVSADSRYITGLTPALIPLDSTDELMHVWCRSYILSGGLDISVNCERRYIYSLYSGQDTSVSKVFQWLDNHYREPTWKSKMYRNKPLELRLFIVLIHLSRLEPLLSSLCNQLRDVDIITVNIPIPEEIQIIWKGVQSVREQLRVKKQDFQNSRDLKGLQRSASFTLNKKTAIKTLSSYSETESETESDTIRLENPIYLSNDKCSMYGPVVTASSSISSDSEVVNVHRSQSDTYQNIQPGVVTDIFAETTHDTVENEYKEFDPDLAESFNSMKEIEGSYLDKLDLLIHMNEPLDITSHNQAFIYSDYNPDIPFTRKTISNTAPPELDDDLPTSITDTVVQSTISFLVNTSAITASVFKRHLQDRIESAKERAQAFLDSVEILEQLREFPQASRLYLLGVQSALISTPNATNYRSKLSQFSPFTNSLDEIQMADFMANIHSVGSDYISSINKNIISFCKYLMRLCEECVDDMKWRLGATVLWILSSDFNNNLIYDPFFIGLPSFYQRLLKKLSNRIGQDVLITAGPYWDGNCTRIPNDEVVIRGKDGSPFKDEYGQRNENSVFTTPPSSAASSQPPSASPSPSPRPIISVNTAINTIKRTIAQITPPLTVNPKTKKRTSDPTYGCFSISVFALANSLRISYGLLLIRQFYDHQLKLKQSRPQHQNNHSWSLDDVFMVFGYDSPRYFQCTRGMFNEFMLYFQQLLSSFETKCKTWKPYGRNVENNSKSTRHGCFRYSNDSPIENNETICPERGDLLISSGESLLSYYLSLITWVLNTYIGGMIDWQSYGDIIWRFMYASPRMRKLAVICLQSIVPYTDYLPSMLQDRHLYKFIFSQKEVEKLPSEISYVLSRHCSTSCVLDDDTDEEEEEYNVNELSVHFHDVDPDQMTQEEMEQAFVYYLLHLCVHDDFCFGAMTEERLACAQCCPFFPYIYQRLSTVIVEEEDEEGNQKNKRKLMFPNPPALQPKSLKTLCKMLIRPEGYGASNCNLVVAEEVVYLLRVMLESERWKALMVEIFEVILEKASEQIVLEKQMIENMSKDKRNENEERERIVWYSMGSGVLKVMGSISRRLYSGCRIRVRQQFMDHITDLDVLIQTIHQSTGTGYVIDYNNNSGEALVLLDRMQVPKLFTIYTLDVVDKVAPPADLSDKTRDFLITYVQRIIINLEYPDDLFELPTDDKDRLSSPFKVVELQNLVLEQNAIYVFHQLMIAFPESVRLLSKEFVSVLFSLALKPSPAKGIFGTEFIRYCFNNLAELLIDTYPGCPHLYQAPQMSSSPQPQLAPSRSDHEIRGESACGEAKTNETNIVFYGEDDRNRLAKARELFEFLRKPISSVYKALKVFHDDETCAVNFLLENRIEDDSDLDEIASCIDPSVVVSPEAAVYDFDCSRSSPLFTGQNVRNLAKKTPIMHSVPYFASFEPATPNNLRNSLNCIASKKGLQNDVVYPIDPTGVVSKVDEYSVTLALLDINSGISKLVTLPYTEVALHKRRFGSPIPSMSSLRKMTARICLNMDLRLLRELIITILHYFTKESIDICKEYSVKPHDLVMFMKMVFVFYSTITSKSSYISGSTHITPVSALVYILKETITMMITREDSTHPLLTELMNTCWVESPYGTIIHSLNNKRYYVSSLHPYYKACRYHDSVTIPRAQALRIVFDKNCCLEKDFTYLTFYKDAACTHAIARFTGQSSHFTTFHVQGPSVYYIFESKQEENTCWGYGFTVEGLTGISWLTDMQVLQGDCYDWLNWELDLILDVIEVSATNNVDFFNHIVDVIIRYICTYGAPCKSKATDILLRILSEPIKFPLTKLPDISGIKSKVYRYMQVMKSTKIPNEIRQVLEVCMSFELYKEMTHLMTSDDALADFPPFQSAIPKLNSDNQSCLLHVHRLARNLYYHSLPEQIYLYTIAETVGVEWNDDNYHSIADTMKHFSQQNDILLMIVYHQKCDSLKIAPSDFKVNEFFLTQEDLIRYNGLRDYSSLELRERLAVIQLFNTELKRIIQYIDIMDINQENRLGSILCALSEYIDPAIKESVLEISIKETSYEVIDNRRPVIVLDSMRTYEDPEDATQRAPILFNESITKNAFSSQCTFAQMYREIMKIDTNLLRAPLDGRERLFAVKYKGEQGLDFGGLYRDTIERSVEDLFSDRIDLFLPCPNSRAEEGINEEKYVPNTKYRHSLEAMDMYIFVGYLIGISLRTKQQLSFELPSIMWKYFIGSQPSVEDLESIDTSFVKLVNDIKEFDEEEAEESLYDTFGITFSVMDISGNEAELIPGGIDIPVTYETAEKWCELAMEFKLNEFKQAAEAISCGIQALVPQRSIALFTWNQLERAVCGEPDIDIEDLKAHTIYANWTEQHPVVKRFWKVMEGLDNKDRSQFLRFTWGRSRLPHKDNWPRPFKLIARNYGDDMLPLAHTCFFEMELPQYSTDQIMRERLLIAIHYGASEFLLR